MLKKTLQKVDDEILCIRRESYTHENKSHLFLIGDLKIPQASPFFFDERCELILCSYMAGEDGLPHWHTSVDEYEIIISGQLIYIESESGRKKVFNEGDLIKIPSGLCVTRVINVPTTTIVIKLPSVDEKVLCVKCERKCFSRLD
jgi:uncharacterized cupin superfamily protein